MIGLLQWSVSLGRFDISTAVMALSTFRAFPREGHLNQAKRIYGYLSKFKDTADLPNYNDIKVRSYDWEEIIHKKHLKSSQHIFQLH